MEYETLEDESNGATTIILLLIFLILALLFVMGVGGLFYLRQHRVEKEALIEVDRAMVAERQARVMAQAEAGKSGASSVRLGGPGAGQIEDATRPLLIEIDRNGQLTVNHVSTELKNLADRIQDLPDDGVLPILVTLDADPRCPFEHVESVIAACRKLNIIQFHIRTSDAATDDAATDDTRRPSDQPITIIK